jgi:hypothetical protein
VDYNAIEKITSAGVTLAPEKKSLRITTGNYALTLEPGQGGRLHNWQCGDDVMVGKLRKWGYAVPAVWYPAEAALMLRSGMKIESITPGKAGITVKLSRTITAKDNPRLAGMKLELTHEFTVSGIKSRARFTNLLHDAVEFAFRFHNMPQLLSRKNRDVGEISFASGEVFKRSYVQKFIRTSAEDPLLEKAYKRTKHISTAKSFPVRISAPWSRHALEVTFSPVLHSIMLWDEERSASSTFEPVFRRTQLAPGQSVEFNMNTKIISQKK